MHKLFVISFLIIIISATTTVFAYFADYANSDCKAICYPNTYRYTYEECTQDPPTCLCRCPSQLPAVRYCKTNSSPYCSQFCGNGGIGYLCIGPSGFQECACFCNPFTKEWNETSSVVDNAADDGSESDLIKSDEQIVSSQNKVVETKE